MRVVVDYSTLFSVLFGPTGVIRFDILFGVSEMQNVQHHTKLPRSTHQLKEKTLMELNETNPNVYSKCALFTPAERNSFLL